MVSHAQKRWSRRLALVAVVLGALLFAAPGLARPRLLVVNPDGRLGGTDPTTLQLSQGRSDRAISKVTILVPAGYSGELDGPAGARVGDVYARVKGPLAGIATMRGPIARADPGKFERSSCADDRRRHDAVWLVSFGSVGGTVQIPLFVDRVTGKAAASASYKLQLCLSTPVGTKASGQRVTLPLLQTTLSVSSVFRNPSHAGSYLWRATFTPWTIGKTTQSDEHAAQAATLVALPAQITLAVKVDRAHGTALLTGTLSAGGVPIPYTFVDVFAGLSQPLDMSDYPALTVETDEHGVFHGAIGIVGPTYFRATATVSARTATADACRHTSSPHECESALAAPFYAASPDATRVS